MSGFPFHVVSAWVQQLLRQDVVGPTPVWVLDARTNSNCGVLRGFRLFVDPGNGDAVIHLGHKSTRVSHGASHLTGFRSTWAAAVTLWRVGPKVRERATAAKTCSKLDCSELGVHLVLSHSFGEHRQDHSRCSCLREPACSAVAGPRSSRPGTTFDRAF